MSAMPETDADRIRQEMVRVRSELHDDVGEVVASARALTDWRQYVRSYPWICLGAAAAAGYLLVPAKRAAPALKGKSSAAKAAATQDAAVESGVKAGATAGILGSLVSMAGTMALRGAMNYASRKASDWVNTKLGEMPPGSALRPAARQNSASYPSESYPSAESHSSASRAVDGPKIYHVPGGPRLEDDV